MGKDTGIQLTDGSIDGTVDLKVDVIRDVSGKIVQGMPIGNTLEQNKAIILIMNPGESKEYPTLGVGLVDAVLSENFLELRHRIRKEFAKDGLQITKLDLYNAGSINIEANY